MAALDPVEETHTPMNNPSAAVRSGFRTFEFEPQLERGIAAAGYEQPRPIQAETMAAALDDRDILGLAQTGTGKTAAFALPLIDLAMDLRTRGPIALVVAPTRELATQIDAEIRMLARYTRVKTLTVFGGVSMSAQIRGLKQNPDILIACPGRLLDLHQQGHVDFSRIESLVLDEADHMFDMGFLPSIRRILDLLPSPRQNMLFSATMPPEIRKLADRILVDPHVVELAHSKPAETIDHALHPVRPQDKLALLEHLLAQDDVDTTIVFTRTKHRARRLARQLGNAGHRAVALQGNMSQGQRDRAMKGFRDGSYDVLVATDIVARGIDVSAVSCVINFDAPNTPEAYTHRIGRTGRSERAGRARTFVSTDDRDWIRATERYLGAPLASHEVSGFDPASGSEDRGRGDGRSKSGAGRHSGGARRSGGRRRSSSSPSRGGKRRGGRGRSRQAAQG